MYKTHTPSVSLPHRKSFKLILYLVNIIPSYDILLSVIISVCLPFSRRGICNSYYDSVSNSIPLAKIAVSLFCGM